MIPKIDSNSILWLLPAGMLLLALAPLPYGYYTLLRLVVTGCAGFISYQSYEKKSKAWLAIFGFIALLFNPIIPVHLDRETWAIIDMICAGVFVFHWWNQGKKNT